MKIFLSLLFVATLSIVAIIGYHPALEGSRQAVRREFDALVEIVILEGKWSKLTLEDRVKRRYSYAHDISLRGDDVLKNLVARKVLLRNLDEDPKHVDSYVLLSTILFNEGYHSNKTHTLESISAADKVINRGLDIVGSNQSLLIAKLAITTRSESKKAALDLLGKVDALGSPTIPRDILRLANVLNDLNLNKRSLELLGNFLKDPRSAGFLETIHFIMALNYAVIEDYENCIKSYETLLQINPETKFAYTNLPICYSYLGRHDDAVRIVDKGLKINKAGMMLHVASNTYCKRGDNYLRFNNFDSAAADYNTSLRILKNASAKRGLSLIKIMKGDIDQGVAEVIEGAGDYDGPAAEYYKPALFTIDFLNKAYPVLAKKYFRFVESADSKLWVSGFILRSYMYQRKSKEFEDFVAEALPLAEHAMSKHPPGSFLQTNAASVYLSVAYFRNDFEMGKRALEIYEANKSAGYEDKVLYQRLVHGPAVEHNPDLKPMQLMRLDQQL